MNNTEKEIKRDFQRITDAFIASKKINIEVKRGKNSIYGNPSYIVIDYDNVKIMEKLIKLGDFKRYKRVGLATANNASFAYEICSNCTIKMYGYTCNFKIIY